MDDTNSVQLNSFDLMNIRGARSRVDLEEFILRFINMDDANAIQFDVFNLVSSAQFASDCTNDTSNFANSISDLSNLAPIESLNFEGSGIDGLVTVSVVGSILVVGVVGHVLVAVSVVLMGVVHVSVVLVGVVHMGMSVVHLGCVAVDGNVAVVVWFSSVMSVDDWSDGWSWDRLGAIVSAIAFSVDNNGFLWSFWCGSWAWDVDWSTWNVDCRRSRSIDNIWSGSVSVLEEAGGVFSGFRVLSDS